MHSFNAGVVVFDLDRWRRTERLDSVARWISRNEASQGEVYKLGSNPPFVLAVSPLIVLPVPAAENWRPPPAS